MPLFFSYIDPAPDELTFSVLDGATRNVWSPAAKAFVPAGGATPPADVLTPLVRVGGPHHQSVRIGYLADFPDPPAEGQYLLYVHPAAGGEPTREPVPVSLAEVRRPLNIAVTVSGG